MTNSTAREKAMILGDQKLEIEKKIDDNYEVLRQAGVDMYESLVDSEDFPRNDVPIYEICTARSNIIKLQNDLQNIILQIEKEIEEYFKQEASQNGNEN